MCAYPKVNKPRTVRERVPGMCVSKKGGRNSIGWVVCVCVWEFYKVVGQIRGKARVEGKIQRREEGRKLELGETNLQIKRNTYNLQLTSRR
jgi:hypothetical protein